MHRIASITVVLFLFLFVSPFVTAQNQRVFVSTSFPPVSLPSQTNQQVILASQSVGLSMRQLWSFDVFAEGVLTKENEGDSLGAQDVDVWICDKPDCSDNVKANIADLTLVVPTIPDYFHLTGTFAQTNSAPPINAVLTGELYSLFTFGCCSNFSHFLTDVVTPRTQPIDLSTGNRYLVLTMTCASDCGVSPSDTMRITVFRVNMLP